MTEGSEVPTDPLVVVSNRLPYDLRVSRNDPPYKRNVGGLVNAVEPVLSQVGGRWVGWDGSLGRSAADVSSRLFNQESYKAPSGIEMYGVPLSERDVQHYYHGFSNRALWPLFHSFPEKSIFDAQDWNVYTKVNRRFAEASQPLAWPRGRIWVHDFHLMRVPFFLRELGYRGRIDFFLHIPFPPPEIFCTLPWRNELIQGMLSADSIAFHVKGYHDNFLRTVTHLSRSQVELNTSVDSTTIVSDRGKSSTKVVPVGIDVEEFEKISERKSVVEHAVRLRESNPGRRILIGIDRLDYTKGIKERLDAVEHFLTKNREARGKIVLFQIVVPSRHQITEYRELKKEIDRQVGRINGDFGSEGWVPIHYWYTALEREQLVAYYRAADVAIVTPLRDGMNLIGAEFAASRVDNDGVLLISEFAGIAEHTPGAIRVNPHDIHGFSNAILYALRMSREERRARMIRLRERVRENPVSKWGERCLEHTPARVAVLAGRTYPQPAAF